MDGILDVLSDLKINRKLSSEADKLFQPYIGTSVDLSFCLIEANTTYSTRLGEISQGGKIILAKIVGTELAQRIDKTFVELAGYHCLPYVPEQFEDGFQGTPLGPGNSAAAALTYFNNRKASIYGGSNEIQRNIICKAVWGL